MRQTVSQTSGRRTAARTQPTLRVMLVDDSTRELELDALEHILQAAGHRVVARVSASGDLSLAVARHTPDVIFIDVNSPSRDTLESLSQISRDRPRPVVLCAVQADTDTIRRAIRAGVSAYIVESVPLSRLQAVLEVAIAHFEQHQALRQELRKARAQLADRGDIEEAKFLLMEKRGVDEQKAFEMLRRIAMDRKLRLGDAARAVLDIGRLL